MLFWGSRRWTLTSGLSPRGEITDLEHQMAVIDQTLKRLAPSQLEIEGTDRKEIVRGTNFIAESETMTLRAKPTTNPLLLEQCKYWLHRARAMLDTKLWVTYPRLDHAWSCVREIRHIFCELAPLSELVRVARDVRDDFHYVPGEKGKDKENYGDELDKLEKHLLSLEALSDQEDTEKDVGKLQLYRAQLARLSLIAANAKQEHWHRVNLMRSRLKRTAITISIVTFGVLAGLAFLSVVQPKQLVVGDDGGAVAIIGVVIFGAIGGFLSALRQHEPLAAGSPNFYVERMLLWLRPVVGAVAALILYVAQLSGVVTFTKNANLWLYLFVAFCAGFSEQFFLAHLTPFLEHSGKKQSSNRAHRTEVTQPEK